MTIPAETQTPPAPARPALPSGPDKPAETGLSEGQQRALVVGGAIAALALLALAVWVALFLVRNPVQAAAVRDVFIIFMALESMVIGVALIVLMVQVAVLTNLLRHEIKPILEATQETANTVRGTAIFVSENVVEPVMKLNSYVAGLERLLDTLATLTSFWRKRT